MMWWPRTEEQMKAVYAGGVVILILIAVALATYLSGWW
jgi:hypothetical protein